MIDHQPEAQWSALWERIEAQRVAESHRAYRTMRHILHCLDEMEHVRHRAVHPDAMAMALWYHDAIYDTHATNNEEQSAALAAHTLRNASIPEPLVQRVVRLIMATKDHTREVDLDTRLLVDIDLAILGQSAPIFDAYEQQIRQEYAWVPHTAFLEGRTRILHAFLQRATIYATDHFRQRYETQARLNIARSL